MSAPRQDKSGWIARAGGEPPQMPEPMAEVRVKIYELSPGGAQIEVKISPTQELADGLRGGPAREAAYNRLLVAVEREVRSSFALLGRD